MTQQAFWKFWMTRDKDQQIKVASAEIIKVEEGVCAVSSVQRKKNPQEMFGVKKPETRSAHRSADTFAVSSPQTRM